MWKPALASLAACALAIAVPNALAAVGSDATPTTAPPTTSAAPSPCTPPAKIYALSRWRVEHPARGKAVCETADTGRLRRRFYAYADRRFRACEPADCQRWAARSVSPAQMRCLVPLWSRESGWRRTANNPSSGAHGIPEALPGSKMGPGWQDDGKVQIRWGLGYIESRYGTPCNADARQAAQGWY
jgi:hypothetical protein